MDTVKLVDMLSKLGVIKTKKRRQPRQQPAEQAMPLYGASKFLGSRPVISLSNNVDSAKVGEADAVRRQAFYHIGQLEDALQRSQRPPEQATRLEPNRMIERPRDVEPASEQNVVPDIQEAEFTQVGPNDATAEMHDDRIVDYAGEGGGGLVEGDDEENDFVEGEPRTPDESPPESEEDEPFVRAEYTPEASAVYEPEIQISNPRLNRMLRSIIVTDFPKLKESMTINDMQLLVYNFTSAIQKQFPDQADRFTNIIEPVIAPGRKISRATRYELLRDAIEAFGKSNRLV